MLKNSQYLLTLFRIIIIKIYYMLYILYTHFALPDIPGIYIFINILDTITLDIHRIFRINLYRYIDIVTYIIYIHIKLITLLMTHTTNLLEIVRICDRTGHRFLIGVISINQHEKPYCCCHSCCC